MVIDQLLGLESKGKESENEKLSAKKRTMVMWLLLEGLNTTRFGQS